MSSVSMNPVSTNPDVLIIGAGPVGLTMAAELHRYGFAVRILDQDDAPTDKSKALVVWPRTLEHLARLGIADNFAQHGLKGTQAKFFQRDKEIATVQLTDVETPYPYALLVPQSETEGLLLQHLTSQGVIVERDKTLTALTQTADTVTATITHKDGSAETVTTPWLIAADGAHSATRHLLNATFEGETLSSDWVLADVRLEGPVATDTVALHFHEKGIAAIFPVPPNRFRVIANTASDGNGANKDAAAPADPSLEDIQQILDERTGLGLRAVDPVWLSAFHINERKVADFRHGRVFLAGDAAHIHSPAGGQGMNTGMQDAFNLAWKLALVDPKAGHKGVAANYVETLLSSYTAERGPVAEDVLKGSGFLTRMGTVDNALLRGLRNFGLHSLLGFGKVQHVFAENVTELNVAYERSPLNAEPATSDGLRPGSRYPIREGDAPVSAGSQPLYTLFAAADNNAEQFIACFPGHLDPIARPPYKPGTITLVRPDGYVAFSGLPNEYPAADAYMNRIIWGLEPSGATRRPLIANS